MKILYWSLATLLFLAIGVFGLQYVASERVEVVQLHTLDANGEELTTRLWVVDDEGYQYLRAGDTDSGWAARLLASPSFALTRHGGQLRYVAVVRPDKRQRINDLMQAKYTWGDTVIALLVGDRDSAMPLELHMLD